jgi:ferrous iron transport protein B
VGNRNRGIDALLAQCLETADEGNGGSPLRKVRYSHDIEEAIEALLPETAVLLQQLEIPYTPRWTAIKLLENDEIIRQRLSDRAQRREGRWHLFSTR